jgi:hypothetical protein
MENAGSGAGVQRPAADPPQLPISSCTSERARLREYFEQSAAMDDAFESVLHIANGKLIEQALCLQDDLDAVRALLADPQERLAADLETSEGVYKVHKAMHEQSQMLLRMKRLREKADPRRNIKSKKRSRRKMKTQGRSTRPK